MLPVAHEKGVEPVQSVPLLASVFTGFVPLFVATEVNVKMLEVSALTTPFQIATPMFTPVASPTNSSELV